MSSNFTKYPNSYFIVNNEKGVGQNEFFKNLAENFGAFF